MLLQLHLVTPLNLTLRQAKGYPALLGVEEGDHMLCQLSLSQNRACAPQLGLELGLRITPVHEPLTANLSYLIPNP